MLLSSKNTILLSRHANKKLYREVSHWVGGKEGQKDRASDNSLGLHKEF